MLDSLQGLNKLLPFFRKRNPYLETSTALLLKDNPSLLQKTILENLTPKSSYKQLFSQINEIPHSILKLAYLHENTQEGKKTGRFIHDLVRLAKGNIINKNEDAKISLQFLTAVANIKEPIELLTLSVGNVRFKEEYGDYFTPIWIQAIFEYENTDSKGRVKSDKFDRELTSLSINFRENELWRRFMRKIIIKTTVIDNEELADSYIYAASFHNKGQASDLIKIISKIEKFGPEKLSLLRQFFGIYALNRYTDEQLDSALRIASGDRDEIKRLQDRDTQVVFINNMSDYIGSFLETPQEYDDIHKRTILFETQGWIDVYRSMSKLNKLGIKPAKIIFANHGEPGYAPIVKKPTVGEVGFYYQSATVNKVENNNYNTNYHINDIDGFSRIVNSYMQPSRNINDPPSIKGEKIIIFHSCSQAAKLETNSESGTQQHSVITRLAYELSKKVKDPYKIYGSPVVGSFTRTPKGFKLEQHNKDNTFTPVKFIAISVNSGAINMRTPKELPLTLI